MRPQRVLLLALLPLACDQSQPPPGMTAGPGMPGTAAMPGPATPYQTGTATPPASTVAPMPPNPFAVLGQMAQAMTAQPGAPGTVQIVGWRDLANAIPAAVPGWEADGEVDGSTGSLGGLGGSNARRRFRQGDRSLSFEIADTSFNQMLVMPFNLARAVTVDSSTELKRAQDVQGQPGFLEYRYSDRNAKQLVLAHGRFMVTVEVDSAQGPEEVVAHAGLVNFGLLAQLHAASQTQVPPTGAP